MAFSLDPALIDGARRGNPAEIERLLSAVWPDAFRLALAIAGDRQGAEDAAQEACIALYRHIGALRASEAFHVWFSRIVVREASALKRRRARTEPAVDDAAREADVAGVVDVWRALATLPPGLRAVVVLRYFEDLSSREIAAVLCVPAGTVRFRLAIARRRLRPLLGESAPSSRSPMELRHAT